MSAYPDLNLPPLSVAEPDYEPTFAPGLLVRPAVAVLLVPWLVGKLVAVGWLLGDDGVFLAAAGELAAVVYCCFAFQRWERDRVRYQMRVQRQEADARLVVDGYDVLHDAYGRVVDAAVGGADRAVLVNFQDFDQKLAGISVDVHHLVGSLVTRLDGAETVPYDLSWLDETVPSPGGFAD